MKGSLFHGYLDVRTHSSALKLASQNWGSGHVSFTEPFTPHTGTISRSFVMTASRRRLECLAAVQASSLGFEEPSAHPKREGHSRHTSHARECKDKPCEHLRGGRLLDRLSSREANTSLQSESRERKALPSQSDPDSSTFPPRRAHGEAPPMSDTQRANAERGSSVEQFGVEKHQIVDSV